MFRFISQTLSVKSINGDFREVPVLPAGTGGS
jgi:hypothetical protein